MKTIRFIALLLATASLAVAATNDITTLVQKGLFEEEANHNLEAAMQHYQTAIGSFDQDRKLIATAVFRLGECYRKQGKTNEAGVQYHRILQEFPDQTELAKLSVEYAGSPTAAAQPNSKADTKEQDLRASWDILKLQETTAKLLYERVLKFSLDERISYFTTIDRDASVEKLAADLAVDEESFAQATNNFGPKSLEFQNAKAALNGIKSQIEKRVSALVWSLGQNASALTEQRTAVEGQLQATLSAEAKKTSFTRFHSSSQPEQTSTTNGEDEEIRKIITMIQNSPDLINAADMTEGLEQGYAPLHKAALHGQTAVAEFLLSAGADIEGTAKNYTHYTPLILAATQGHKAMVELLLAKGAKVNAMAENDCTALHQACSFGFKAVTEVLLTHGASVTIKTKDGWTPLHSATTINSSADIAALLLEHKADVNARNNQGITPLCLAIGNNQTEMVRLFLQHNAEVNSRNNRLETPLHSAVWAKNPEIIQLLIDHKADINAAALGGFTPLLTAVSQDGANLDVVKMLLANGANIQAQVDDNFDTQTFHSYYPLNYAINYNNHALLQLLLANHADPNAAIANPNLRLHHRTPLCLAMGGRGIEAAMALLVHGADPNLVSIVWDPPEKWIPLHVAVKDGNKKMVEALLAHHANVNILDVSGNPPIYYAESSPEITALLVKAGADEYFSRRKGIFLDRNGTLTSCFDPRTIATTDYTLLRLFDFHYAIHNGLPFPDFAHVTIHRLKPGGGTNDIKVDVAAFFRNPSTDKDVPLLPGDIIELPELDHPAGERWVGLPKPTLETIQKYMMRPPQ